MCDTESVLYVYCAVHVQATSPTVCCQWVLQSLSLLLISVAHGELISKNVDTFVCGVQKHTHIRHCLLQPRE